MIRVLHIVNRMSHGGIENFIMNVYRNIDRRHVLFDFLVHSESKGDFDDEIISLGGRIHHAPARNKGILKNRIALGRFFEDHPDYKIVHQHSSSLSYVGPLKAAQKHNVPIRIIHGHSTREGGSLLHKYIHRWNRIFVKSYATHHFACSNVSGNWMYGKQTRYININNGILTSEFMFDEKRRNQVRSSLGVEQKYVVGHVGRLSYPKNHDYLIDIFRAVVSMVPNAVLLLVGDGELREQIERKVHGLELSDRVILAGNRSDIPDLLQAMDIFILPSLYEGFPVTLVEAQTTGLPCVVSDHITSEVNLTNDVYFINLLSPLSSWVDKALELKECHMRRDGRNAVLQAGFDIEHVARELQSFYQSNQESDRGLITW